MGYNEFDMEVPQMSVADNVIARFGGAAALARMLGKGPSTVQYWRKVGVIPAKWHSPLLSLANERGIDLSPAELVQEPTRAVEADNLPTMPIARWPGILPIGEVALDVYVLHDGQRVISRTGAVRALVGPQGGGNLENYIGTRAVVPYMPSDLSQQMVDFILPGVVNKTVQGIKAETFLDICRAFVRARDDDQLTTERQKDIAIKAGMFLSACANIGLIALIDEATGYQYDRAQDALQIKLRLYLEEEMRRWEKTFPDDLWKELGRLTNWQKPLHERPKYWGKLVMELIYEYLDPDVTDWLRKNAPRPQHGQNYHQWLSSQYGLKKLIEHIWMVIGMASACNSLTELRRKMAEKYGRVEVHVQAYLPLPGPDGTLPKQPELSKPPA
jgi:hypothetical protein